MGYAADSQTIRALFEAQWPTKQSTVPRSYADLEYDPPENEPWVRLTILPGDQRQVSMGRLRRFRRVGVVMVQIFVPAGSGDGTAKDLADSVTEIFEGQTVNGVIFRGTGLTRIGADGAWVQYNATTPYQADDLIANPTP